jgi:large subunit ribosomal protein L35
MPKLKTHRGAAKRFTLTASGKVKRSKAFASHILTKKTTKRKRNLRKSTLVDSANHKAIKKLIPYV